VDTPTGQHHKLLSTIGKEDTIMGKLIREFHKKRLLPKNRECSDGWNQENIRKVETFLVGLEKKYKLQEIGQIRQKHYDWFMDHLSDERKPETLRKYALSIRRFVETSKLPIKISPENAKRRKLERRSDLQREILVRYGIEEEQLESLLKELSAL